MKGSKKDIQSGDELSDHERKLIFILFFETIKNRIKYISLNSLLSHPEERSSVSKG